MINFTKSQSSLSLLTLETAVDKIISTQGPLTQLFHGGHHKFLELLTFSWYCLVNHILHVYWSKTADKLVETVFFYCTKLNKSEWLLLYGNKQPWYLQLLLWAADTTRAGFHTSTLFGYCLKLSIEYEYCQVPKIVELFRYQYQYQKCVQYCPKFGIGYRWACKSMHQSDTIIY